MGTTTNFPGIKPFPSIQTITLVQAPITFLLEFSKSVSSDLSSSVLVPLCSIIHIDSVISAKYKPHLLPFLLKTLQPLPVGFRIEPKLLPVFFQSPSLCNPCLWVPVTLSLSHGLFQPSPTSHSPAHPSVSTPASLSSSLSLLG